MPVPPSSSVPSSPSRGVASSRTADVVVVGGGLIGASAAWRLAQRGLSVALIVGDPTMAASGVAAGMLAPVTETTFTEERLLRLTLESVEMYDAFCAELTEASDQPAGLLRTPTLSVAHDADDAARLTALADYLSRIGHDSARLTSRECRRQEPLLSPSVRGGLLVETDWSCDNRLLWSALRTAAERAGVHAVQGTVAGIDISGNRVHGVTLDDGRTLSTDRVLLANGAWAGGLELPVSIPVRPVKGQILRLDPEGRPQPGLTVRAFSRGAEVYLVPRSSGREVVVGATVEDLGFDTRVTAGGVYEVLRDARSVVPISAEYALSETSVGFRPGTPDNAPILGPSGVDGLTLATGHYRNGVLLTPVTAAAVTASIVDGRLPESASAFTIARFTDATPGGST